MKGFVFLGWSKNRDLAIAVKDELAKHGYSGVVGGDYEHNPEAVRLRNRTVNETVCYQMDHCDQAIMLFSRPGEGEQISGNLLYELGYMASRFKSTGNGVKLHIFKIDITASDYKTFFPSDLHGQWERDIMTAGRPLEEVARDVVDEFLRCQHLLVKQNKMQVISNYHIIEYELDCHFTNPQLSHSEMAKRIGMYVQAAFIYQEHGAAKIKCRTFRNRMQQNGIQCDELSYALDYAMRAFELFELATPQEDGDGRIHLPGRTFRSILRSFAAAALGANGQVASPDGGQGEAYEILFSEEEINDEEYKTWLVSQIQEHITYLFLVYLDNPDLDEEERQEMLALAIRYGEAAVHNLNLLRPLPGNAEYADLFLGYTYRNLSLFCHMAGQEARAEENERLAFAVRKRLYDTIFRNENVNPELKDYIALEYFLEITDIIPGMKDKYQAEDWKEEIRDYVEERKKRESNRSMMFIRLCSALKKLT